MYVSGHLYMSDTMSLAPGFRLLDPRLPGVTIFISGSMIIHREDGTRVGCGILM